MAREQQSSDALIGTTLGGKYLVRRLIGAGGMGAVYEVEHVFTKRIGALKLLRENFALVPSAAERFIREASAAGRIGNPHIVETMDAGTLERGAPYMFMEMLDGFPVSKLIETRSRLEIAEALDIVIQAAEALAAAHAAGIVHRDVKPDNLIVCRAQSPFVKVIDFGISKFAHRLTREHHLTQEGAPLGTPLYMSPEQTIGHKDIDGRTDVYSLAVVLYECVTGRVPFDAETLPALCMQIHQGKFTAASALRSDVPPELDAVISRAMAVDRDQRTPTMAALLQELGALRSGLQGSAMAVATEPEALRRPSEPANRSASVELSLSRADTIEPLSLAAGRDPRAEPGNQATTGQPVSSTAHVPPSSKRARVWVALGLVIVVSTAGAVWALRRAPDVSGTTAQRPAAGADTPLPRRATTGAGSAPAPAGPSPARGEATAARDEPAAESAVSPTLDPARTSSVSAHAVQRQSTADGRARAPSAKRPGAKSPKEHDAPAKSQAAEDGLSEENPFVEPTP
jgi:serine/threonine protein kinase